MPELLNVNITVIHNYCKVSEYPILFQLIEKVLFYNYVWNVNLIISFSSFPKKNIILHL